jgi:hypothetical protein
MKLEYDVIEDAFVDTIHMPTDHPASVSSRSNPSVAESPEPRRPA